MDKKCIKMLLKRDREHVWHPYTQMKDFESRDPLFVDRGSGVFLFDVYGMAYYDTISSWWCITHGHNHPHIKECMLKQMERLDHVHFAGTTHRPGIELAQRLCDLLPPRFQRVFFSDNGSTAVEVALKMAVQYWHIHGKEGKKRFVSLERGYHGDTLGTMGLGGVPQFKGPFDDLTVSSHRLPAPYCYRCPVGLERETCDCQCLLPLEALLEQQADTLAAVVLEPLVMGAGGMLVYPERYLKRLHTLLKDKDVFLIFDEVATGFGRTGEMFAFVRAGVEPDFICLSKGLTAGTLPLAATITTDTVFNAFYSDYNEGRTFFHGHTFTANPISCAAALASLDIFERDQVIEQVKTKEEIIKKLSMELTRLPFVGDCRSIGMIAAFELVKDKDSKEPYPPEERIGWKVYLQGLKNGLILRPLGDVTYLFLPLVTTERQIQDIFDRLWETFIQCKKQFLN